MTAEYGDDFRGLVTFYASFDAIRAEKVLSSARLACRLIPGPRDISPHCGVALQFEWPERDRVQMSLDEHQVRIEAMHTYELKETLKVKLNRSGTPPRSWRQWRH